MGLTRPPDSKHFIDGGQAVEAFGFALESPGSRWSPRDLKGQTNFRSKRKRPTEAVMPAERKLETPGRQVLPETISENPHVLAQKDTDARWTKKNDVSYFCYKDHALADEKHKLIRDYDVTDASVHDSVPLLDLVPKKPLRKNQPVYADSAHVGEDIENGLKKRKYEPMICEKG